MSKEIKKDRLLNFEKLAEAYHEERAKERYNNAGLNPNNLSRWYPEIKNIGFRTPKTEFFKLDTEEFEWLLSDNYKPEKIEKFTESLLSKVSNEMKNLDKKFVKTGVYSGKFMFRDNCMLTENKDLGQHYLDIFYSGMCVGCELSNEVVIREFIETPYQRESIYEGMKLNTEFRIFYDFDTNKVLGIFNYWDRETMINGLYSKENITAFLKDIDILEKEFNENKKELEIQCIENLKKVRGLVGIWSVDFLYDGRNFILIDMAIGKQSYYFNKLNLEK